MDTNAKTEFLNSTSTYIVECAIITRVGEEDIILKVDHSVVEYKEFLNKLDFTYDDGYGEQLLFGTIWLDNNTWLERGEYDGSEWWEAKYRPDIPSRLK